MNLNTSGRIRFFGGPWHNQIPHVETWTVAVRTPTDEGECLYRLCRLRLHGTTFFEYLHEGLVADDMKRASDELDWAVDGFFIEPWFSPIERHD